MAMYRGKYVELKKCNALLQSDMDKSEHTGLYRVYRGFPAPTAYQVFITESAGRRYRQSLIISALKSHRSFMKQTTEKGG